MLNSLSAELQLFQQPAAVGCVLMSMCRFKAVTAYEGGRDATHTFVMEVPSLSP